MSQWQCQDFGFANIYSSSSKLYLDQSEASKSKMAARGPQNGRRGLEMGPTLGYWPFRATLVK